MNTFNKKSKGVVEVAAECCTGDSEIQKFYSGKTILLTGSTGFMGMSLVEKLLRGCPNLAKIYVIVRPKKGVSIEERMKKYFDNAVFDTVRKMYPNCDSKIHTLEGDLERDNIGLSEKDRSTLIEEVNFIIHNASNVKFNEKISIALNINVMGTTAMINLAKICRNLEAFMYVSTAYSHCYQQYIKEEVYESPADAKSVHDILAMDAINKDGMSDKVLNGILGKYPNTYCFTKATAEGLVDQLGKEAPFPCVIYRPAIVVSSWKEPVRSWCGNLNGPAMLFAGYGLGVVHAAYLKDRVIDFIPVDMCINSMIVAIWDASKNRAHIKETLVYNYGSSTTKPMTIRKFKTLCTVNGRVVPTPSIHTLWPDFVIMTECVYFFALLHILLHFIPAVIVDAILYFRGEKMQAVSAYKKITLSYSKLTYFFHGDWRIHTTEMLKAIDRMSSVDRQLFFCDVRELDWADYCTTYWDGLRLFLLKDPITTLPAAMRKVGKLEVIQSILKYALLLSIVYIMMVHLFL